MAANPTPHQHLQTSSKELVFRAIQPTELEIYKNRAMSSFPNTPWTYHITSLHQMLNIFPDGLQAAWTAGHIIGYISFWPVKKQTYEYFSRIHRSEKPIQTRSGAFGVFFLFQ